MKVKAELCRSCRAPIFWAVMPSSSLAPIDLEPDPAGLVVIGNRQNPISGAPYVDRVLKKDEEVLLFDGEERFTSHFATCPDAKDWRKG